jgi:uncharacterized membrane protein YdjX (TVP38/TMEM64 family)
MPEVWFRQPTRPLRVSQVCLLVNVNIQILTFYYYTPNNQLTHHQLFTQYICIVMSLCQFMSLCFICFIFPLFPCGVFGGFLFYSFWGLHLLFGSVLCFCAYSYMPAKYICRSPNLVLLLFRGVELDKWYKRKYSFPSEKPYFGQ